MRKVEPVVRSGLSKSVTGPKTVDPSVCPVCGSPSRRIEPEEQALPKDSFSLWRCTQDGTTPRPALVSRPRVKGRCEIYFCEIKGADGWSALLEGRSAFGIPVESSSEALEILESAAAAWLKDLPELKRIWASWEEARKQHELLLNEKPEPTVKTCVNRAGCPSFYVPAPAYALRCPECGGRVAWRKPSDLARVAARKPAVTGKLQAPASKPGDGK